MALSVFSPILDNCQYFQIILEHVNSEKIIIWQNGRDFQIYRFHRSFTTLLTQRGKISAIPTEENVYERDSETSTIW